MLSIDEILHVWRGGGWVMIPLALLSLIIYTNLTQLLLFFSGQNNYKKIPEEKWNSWIENPSEAKGSIGRIIRYTQDGVDSLNDVGNRFAEVVTSEIPRIDRRIIFVTIMVNLAPLLGLLGTVLGMLETFRAIATASGGHTIDLVADGIAVALITTQTGLTIAIPGYFLANTVKRKRNEYVGFLARLESVSMLHFKRKFEA